MRRNQVKRRVREWFRRHREHLVPRDVIVIARPGAAALSYAEIAAELAPPLRG